MLCTLFQHTYNHIAHAYTPFTTLTENITHILQDSVKTQLSQIFRNLKRTSHQPEVQGDYQLLWSWWSLCTTSDKNGIAGKQSIHAIMQEFPCFKSYDFEMQCPVNKMVAVIASRWDSCQDFWQLTNCDGHIRAGRCWRYIYMWNCVIHICMHILWDLKECRATKLVQWRNDRQIVSTKSSPILT